MTISCTGNRDLCECRMHSNLRNFYDDPPTDAYGSDRHSTGKKYEWLDSSTLLSEHEKQEVRTFGIVLRKSF